YDVFFLVEGCLRRSGVDWLLGGPLRVSAVNRRGATRLSIPSGVATLRFGRATSTRVDVFATSICDLGVAGVGAIVPKAQVLPEAGFPAIVEIDRREIP